MGIHGIYKEIGPGRRVALSKYSVEHYLEHSRPLRLAIDISIWLFQIQSGKGGSNPALRTFYYRLLRILSLNIHPLFVFDGPNKPLFKRNKRVGGPNVKVSSIPEFLAKQLLKQFGFPMHLAPGEAEAECALLQREGIVDAVLSEDVDTLMFGSGTTMRSWTPEAKSSKVPTHVNVYEAATTKQGSGLDREGMILIALMSGGDYIPEGIPGCGPKTACEAARAGFGAELCKLKRRDDAGFTEWRERLRHELWTNESKLFKQRRRLNIPDDFPNREVLGYYTNPCVSAPDRLAQLKRTLRWDMPLDYPALRSFTADAFDWVCLGGAKKFIRNLAPAILTRELRLRAEQGANDGDDLEVQASAEDRLVTAIHGRRTHASTDNMAEVRISFRPLNIIDIDLSQEPPDEEVQAQDSDSEAPVNDDVEVESNCPASPRKRGPSKYNPDEIEKIWMMDVFLRHGVPLKVQDWEASFTDAKKYLAAKRVAKDAGKKKIRAKGDMPRGALDRFTRVTKPGISRIDVTKQTTPDLDGMDPSGVPSSSAPARSHTTAIGSEPLPSSRPLSKTFTRPLSSRGVLEEVDLTQVPQVPASSRPEPCKTTTSTSRAYKRPSPDPLSPAPHHRSKSETPRTSKTKQITIIDLLSSPAPVRRLDFTPSPRQQTKDLSCNEFPPLPDTVTKRRRKSPFKRHETAPAGLGDLCAHDGELDDEVDVPGLGLPSLEHMRASRIETLSKAGQTKVAGALETSGAPARQPARCKSPTETQIPETVDLSSTSDLVLGSVMQTSTPALTQAPPAQDALPTIADLTATSTATAPPTKEARFFAPFAAASRSEREPAAVEVQARDTMKPKMKEKKKYYQIRESLEGAWKEVEMDVEEEVDLTIPDAEKKSGMIMAQFVRPAAERSAVSRPDGMAGEMAVSRKQRKLFRKSEVEVMDLTGEM
ncbi:Flap endonuclease GEN 1 [Sphaceloma murrayae]|uniref:Flap endonuclease GEN 1 n=1 Tax=Sphaceloma murrayae TaxID=2082308 RepID=A0A2K1QJ02_9PEZI|nr:Flap endonuclease GEN 1 [Sphaceloma murrayae]